MYELKVKKGDIWYNLDMDSVPSMTYTSNDIAELENRGVDRSLRLTLPYSKANNAFFENAEYFEAATNVPYRTFECRLYSNEYEIAKQPFLILDKTSAKGYECQILSGSMDLIQILKDSSMNDTLLVDESGKDKGYIIRGTEAMKPANFTSLYRFAIAGYTKSSKGMYLFTGNEQYAFPLIRQDEMVRRILGSHGFTWQHNIQADFKRYLSLSSIKAMKDSFSPVVAITTAFLNGWYFAGSGGGYYEMQFSGGQFLTPFDYTTSAKWDRGVTFKSPISGSMLCRITISGKAVNREDGTGACIGYELSIIRADGSVVARPYDDNGYNEEKTYSYEDVKVINDIEKDEIITIKCDLKSTLEYSGGNLENFTVKVEFGNMTPDDDFESDTPIGGKLYFAPNLGFDTQWDFVKAFVQQYGLTIFPDYRNKILYTYTLDKLYENKPLTKDWSEKLHKANPYGYTEQSFRIKDYAQINRILFEANDVDNVTDAAQFPINNTTLDKSKDLFTIPFESGKDVNITVVTSATQTYPLNNVASIPLLAYDTEDEDLTVEFNERKPHFVELSNNFFDVGIMNSSNVVVATTRYQKANHVKMQTLLNENYDKLVNRMLINVKFIEVQLLLNDKDINEFDQFIPVYISHFGAYFFVNKISNYTSGKITKVELVRMG